MQTQKVTATCWQILVPNLKLCKQDMVEAKLAYSKHVA